MQTDQELLSALSGSPSSLTGAILEFHNNSDRSDFISLYSGVSGITITTTNLLVHIPMLKVTLTMEGLERLQSTALTVVAAHLNKTVHSSLNTSLPSMGVTPVWSAHGYTGAGVVVAVIDSGIDGTHPDLVGRVIGSINLTDEAPTDVWGHGTSVAGVIAGSGLSSSGKYKGVAPQCRLLDVKALDSTGGGTSFAVITGVDWAVQSGAHIINMSLGSTVNADGTRDAQGVACAIAVSQGVLVVAAAGNSGPDAGTINSPANEPTVLAVGAISDSGLIADFSSRGPDNFGNIKPDIAAPGVGVISALSIHVVTPAVIDGVYRSRDGTSLACPHVAGLAALVLQARGGMTPAQVRQLLLQSATPLIGISPYLQGAGALKASTAFTWLRRSMTLRLSTGFRAAWMTYAGLQGLMQYGVIDVYTGEQPESADEPPTGTRIARITQNGLPFQGGVVSGGLFLSAYIAGEVSMSGDWVLKGLASGTAGWFRWKANYPDGDLYSLSRPRMDGAIPADLLLETTAITIGTEFSLQEFKLLQPAY